MSLRRSGAGLVPATGVSCTAWMSSTTPPGRLSATTTLVKPGSVAVQIPKWVLLEQRHERDDAECRPRWVPPKARDRAGLLDWETPVPVARRVSRRRWSSRRKHLTGLAVAWPVAAIAAWIGLAAHQLVGSWQDQAVTAIAGSLALVVWVWAGVPVRRRGRRKAAARIRRRLQVRRRSR